MVYMLSTIVKRSVIIAGRKTSVSLEDPFWGSLKELAAAGKMTVSELVANIASQKQGNLSSALRLFVLESFKRRVVEPHEGTADQSWSSGSSTAPRDGIRQD